ncbi:hypothetical protein [Agarilytica rhodophyticola]|uniref:hypothetical protein n=1 Tax=Agarilytica rhodophyticola TaxID=1737490 RepID=UPI000B349D5D|nr:hypothetical protein [Agarilytica rhodophyticola]
MKDLNDFKANALANTAANNIKGGIAGTNARYDATQTKSKGSDTVTGRCIQGNNGGDHREIVLNTLKQV